MLFFFIFCLIHQSASICTHKIFCQGNLLHTVQMARIFPDSKTFVDMKLKTDQTTTLQNFQKLIHLNPKPNRTLIKKFVSDNFENFDVFEKWVPNDFTRTPKFLNQIEAGEVREFARSLVMIWPKLARKVKKQVFEEAESFSLVPVPNGFIVPGGRFREFYYWDSYWIIEGLLLCEMFDTARGMLDNFIFLVKKYGFVPNGSRSYYLNRSQPPLLTLMVSAYFKATNDSEWLHKNIQFVEQEVLNFFKNRVTEVEKNGTKYYLAHYSVKDDAPRPESYCEDVKAASILTKTHQKKKLFSEIKSAAESGWDFSSRWIVDDEGGNNANLTYIKTSRIIPVDLNSYLCQSFRKLSEFYVVLNNYSKADHWLEKFETWKKSIQYVFYDDGDGIWYDFDKVTQKPRKYFYPSNFGPLWTNCYDLSKSEEIGRRATKYLADEGVLEFDGGVPTSLVQSGEQWDYPNAWAPLQAIVIFGLDQTENVEAKQVASDLAKKWIESNLVSFYETNKMFEKYSVVYRGESGKGGEYSVQSGFGWTNGFMLQLINKYYKSPKLS